MPGRAAMAVDQYILASPINVNNVSTPSASKARASMSDVIILLIFSRSFFFQRGCQAMT